ncbi:hypothetical protein KIPB_000251 [Kipferlia bialata]|uniref:Leucine-rich repeat-containing N-terminal plant-type domain-containing protein n=1 Tax=Kipferlia bialata TaxID=797122 RepID=A0A9K3GET6_9EUKA|nr:hypothetical protein KIPB_000251 [Kipferlia bialata]|eukprot:g251.t1
MRLVFVALCLVSAVLSQCTTQEQALIDLYNGTNGPSWTQANNWLSADPYCTWTGVTCSGNNSNVRDINLNGFGLTGQLPDTIGCFPFLQFLTLANNNMSSTIPLTIGDLPNIKSINMNAAGLVGPIPDTICNLDFIQSILMGNNMLTGPIPSCVDQNTFLQEWSTPNNILTGAVPTEFDDLDFLQRLVVQCNPSLVCTPLSGTFQYMCGNDFPSCPDVPPECTECLMMENYAWCVDESGEGTCALADSIQPGDCASVVTELAGCAETCLECLDNGYFWCLRGPAGQPDECIPTNGQPGCPFVISDPAFCQPIPDVTCPICLVYDGYVWCLDEEGEGSCVLETESDTCAYVVDATPECQLDPVNTESDTCAYVVDATPECQLDPVNVCEDCIDLDGAWCYSLFGQSECIPSGALPPSGCNDIITDKGGCDPIPPTDCEECLAFEDTVWCVLPDSDDACYPDATPCREDGGVPYIDCIPPDCCPLCTGWDGYAWCVVEDIGTCLENPQPGDCDYIVETPDDCDSPNTCPN